jgi:hypothetical protein
MTTENLSKEGLLYLAVVSGGFVVDSFREGDKLWGTILLLVCAGLIILRTYIKDRILNKKK